MLVAQGMRAPHLIGELLVVLAKLGEHVERSDELSVIVEQPLLRRDLPDRAQRRSADLAHPLGNRVGRSENLVRLLIEQQMEVAEMWPRNVPVEILGLHIKREHV